MCLSTCGTINTIAFQGIWLVMVEILLDPEVFLLVFMVVVELFNLQDYNRILSLLMHLRNKKEYRQQSVDKGAILICSVIPVTSNL